MKLNFKNTISIFAAAVLLTACGSSDSSAPTTASGTAVDGYLSGASVYLNGEDTGFKTDANGKWNITQKVEVGDVVSVQGGTDTSTGAAFEGALKIVLDDTPTVGTIATPISTLIAAKISSTKTGDKATAAEIATNLSFISDMPLFWMFLLVALFVSFSTEVTSNTALTSIALPIFYEFAKFLPQEQSTMILMTATVAASYAFMLPIATPPNAIAMSSGAVTVKSMAAYGILFNIIGIILIVAIAKIFWIHVI